MPSTSCKKIFPPMASVSFLLVVSLVIDYPRHRLLRFLYLSYVAFSEVRYQNLVLENPKPSIFQIFLMAHFSISPVRMLTPTIPRLLMQFPVSHPFFTSLSLTDFKRPMLLILYSFRSSLPGDLGSCPSPQRSSSFLASLSH